VSIFCVGQQMFTTEVQFQAKAIGDDDADLLGTLVALWRNNGQVLGKTYTAAFAGRTYSLFLTLPELTALAPAHNSPYVAQQLERLDGAGFKGPTIKPLGRDPFERPICACATPTHYVLYTTYAGFEPSLMCGRCFHPVPLYRVPYETSSPDRSALHDRINTWQSNYRACDQLNMSCSVGEAFGLRQMGQLTSPLSQQGIAVCKDIARLTGVPTYYYLHRYRGRSAKAERARCCPGCGGTWLLAAQSHIFDFKCDACRLLSNIARSI
jgi:predicted  nucleic acid-binding Zn ribbon protein